MSNGAVAEAALAKIPGGRLRKDAAKAWNDMNAESKKRFGVELYPAGPRSSYRTYQEQVYFWNLYQSGKGNLAARPGTSNHGWGTAVDLRSTRMREVVDRIGYKYGWKKVEAPSEWWHVNYVGGYMPKKKSDYDYLTFTEKRVYNEWKRLHKKRAGARRRKTLWKFMVNRRRKLYKAGVKYGWKEQNRNQRYRFLRKLTK